MEDFNFCLLDDTNIPQDNLINLSPLQKKKHRTTPLKFQIVFNFHNWKCIMVLWSWLFYLRSFSGLNFWLSWTYFYDWNLKSYMNICTFKVLPICVYNYVLISKFEVYFVSCEFICLKYYWACTVYHERFQSRILKP